MNLQSRVTNLLVKQEQTKPDQFRKVTEDQHRKHINAVSDMERMVSNAESIDDIKKILLLLIGVIYRKRDRSSNKSDKPLR